MQLTIRVEANEIRKVDEMTVYNHIVWQLTRGDKMGITHIKEIYDDVSDYPRYELGIIQDGKFKYLIGGEGDPIPVDHLGFGGVWTSIDIVGPPDFSKSESAKVDAVQVRDDALEEVAQYVESRQRDICTVLAKRIRALKSSPVAAMPPEGYVLVPVEPTDAMMTQAFLVPGHNPSIIYKAMIAARTKDQP